MYPKSFLLLAFCVAPLSGQAQPYSTSMAQCAGIFDAMSQLVTSPENQKKVATVSAAYLDSARAQAVREGVEDPDKVVDATFTTTSDEWARKGARAVFSQDYRDWTAYCRSFAKDQGIEFDLS